MWFCFDKSKRLIDSFNYQFWSGKKGWKLPFKLACYPSPFYEQLYISSTVYSINEEWV